MRWDDADWRPWRPEEAARRLGAVDVPWYVAAGRAIDLFVGLERRAHEDLELAVPARRFEVVAVSEVPERLGDVGARRGGERMAGRRLPRAVGGRRTKATCGTSCRSSTTAAARCSAAGSGSRTRLTRGST